jgi:hypothetical protein
MDYGNIDEFGNEIDSYGNIYNDCGHVFNPVNWSNIYPPKEKMKMMKNKVMST